MSVALGLGRARLAMHPSQVGLWLADRIPAIARAGVRVWASTYAVSPRREHWLFLAMKSRLWLRVRRQARLLTGQRIWIDPFETIGREIARAGCFEADTVALFRRLLVEGMTFVDAGAHVGQYSLIASELVGAAGEVHAFEPEPANFRQLRANCVLNDLRNVSCNNLALDREAGTALLYQSDIANAGASSLRPTVYYGGRQVSVSKTTLDNYAASAPLRRLDLVKLDVEGAELGVLEGGAEVIGRFKPMLIFEISSNQQLFACSAHRLCQKLLDWNYSLFREGAQPLGPFTPSAGDPDTFNVLAVQSEQIEELARRNIVALPTRNRDS